VNGGDSQEYARVALTGALAAGAYLSISIEAQNGAPDGVALIDTTSGALLDAFSYEGEITAAVIGSQTYNLVEGTALAFLELRCKFLGPVLVGDSIHARVSVAAKREAKKRDRGVVTFRVTIFNQRDEAVQEGEHILMLARRASC
jgi:acyl dehydratase